MARMVARGIHHRIVPRLSRKCPCLHTSSVTRCFSTTQLNLQHLSIETSQSPGVPSDAYQLLSTIEKVGSAENELFDKQVSDVKQWWATPRYEGITRPYSAEDVVGKRGSLQQIYPSSLMARKLFNILREKSTRREPVYTRL